jgi:hypothetical protein
MATVFTLLALAMTVSHWEPGYAYRGTNILIGAVQPEVEEEVGLVVAAAVGLGVAGLVVAATVGVFVAVGLGEVAEVEGLVGAAVGEELVVGTEVGTEVAELPE